MAKRKSVAIDGEFHEVPDTATLANVVPANVMSVITQSGQLVPRERFAQVPVPDGFATNLSAINKGRPSSP